MKTPISSAILDLKEAKWLLGGYRAFADPFVDLSLDAAVYLSDHHCGYLDLSALTYLSPASAAQLARHRGDLDLGGLSDLPPESARKLANHRGVLNLSGITSLDIQTASALADHNGALHLISLSVASEEVLESLASLRYELYLDGIKTLTPNQARALQEHQSFLSLNGLLDLPEEIAVFLGSRTGGISLDSLPTLTPVAVASFATRCHISLKGLTRISPELAESLAEQTARLDLSGLKDLDFASAIELAHHKKELYLDGVNSISLKVAKALALHQSRITLDGLQEIDAAVAQTLASRKGDFSLDALRTFDVHVAANLAKHKGKISLVGLNQLPLEAESVLGIKLFKPDNALSFLEDPSVVDLDQFTHLTEEGVIAIRDWFLEKRPLPRCEEHPINYLHFGSVRSISEAVASRLAEASQAFSKRANLWRGGSFSAYMSDHKFKRPCLSVSLPSVVEITNSTCRELAQFSGDIDLRGLKYLTDDDARMLCSDDGRQGWQPGILNLSGLKRISEPVAYYLSQWKGWAIVLNGLESLSSDAASQLECFRGRVLSLKGLKSIEENHLPSLFSGFLELPELRNPTLEEIRSLSSCSCVELDVETKLSPDDYELSIQKAQLLSGFAGFLSLKLSSSRPCLRAINQLADYVGHQLALNLIFFGFNENVQSALPSLLDSFSGLRAKSFDLSTSLCILTEDALRALSKFKSGINLGDCKFSSGDQLVIDQRHGEILASFKSKWLVLRNPQLTDEGCAALNEYRGWLVLDEVEVISPRQAYLLSLLRGKVLSMPDLTADNDVATQLIKFRGYIDVARFSSDRYSPDVIKAHNAAYQEITRDFSAFRPLFVNARFNRPNAYHFHRSNS